jgi:hypothetical protein
MTPYNLSINLELNNGSEFFLTVLGSFLGFVFTILLFYFSKKYEINTEYMRAIGRTERKLNEDLIRLTALNEALNASCEEIELRGLPAFTLNQIQETSDIGLSNLQLINEIITYRSSIFILNKNVEALDRMLEQLKNFTLSSSAENDNIILSKIKGHRKVYISLGKNTQDKILNPTILNLKKILAIVRLNAKF